jgi:hypothetical protein
MVKHDSSRTWQTRAQRVAVSAARKFRASRLHGKNGSSTDRYGGGAFKGDASPKA